MFTEPEWIAVAERIGAHLGRDALWSAEGCFWVGATPATDGWREVAGLGPTLYAGSAGIGLFLAALAAATGDHIHARHARGALAFARARHGGLGAGLYAGAPGIAFALLLAGRLLPAEGWIESGLDLLAVPAIAAPSGEVDVAQGLAGTILALDFAARRHGLDASAAIRACADAIIGCAQVSPQGASWARAGELPLLGLSHGTAGIAAALSRAGALLGEVRFTDTAARALAYEAAFFDAGRRNWPDYREATRREEASFMSGWCHGAPGVAASRLMISPTSPDLEAGLATTVAALQRPEAESNWCLCHGATGNADILLSAWRAGKGPGLIETVRSVAEYGRRAFHDREAQWPLGEPIAYRQLLTGLAGIGYFYLRLASRGELDSVLVPDPGPDTAPRTRERRKLHQ